MEERAAATQIDPAVSKLPNKSSVGVAVNTEDGAARAEEVI